MGRGTGAGDENIHSKLELFGEFLLVPTYGVREVQFALHLM